MSEYSIALIGNPNSGKTTLFNDLTGAHQRVGNWPGVTVEKKTGQFSLGGRAEIVILFPEGSRGDPEKMGAFKKGIAHVARRHPDVPVYPIYMHGLGKALPRGEALLVPFFCDVFIGEPMCWTGDKTKFVDELSSRMNVLVKEGDFAAWE